MKKLSLLIGMLCLCMLPAHSQNYLKELGNSAKNAAKNATKKAVERNVEKKVEEGVDKAFNPNLNKKKDAGKPASENREAEQNAPEERNETAAAATPAAPQQKASAIVWNNYDFVAGDEIIFDDNLENEKMGEFPSQMDLFQGNVQIVMVDGIKCISSEDGVFTPFFKKPYLTDEFTIEFDIYMYDNETYKQNHPDIGVGINHYEIILATSDDFHQYDGNETGIFLNISACEEFANIHDPVRIDYQWDVPNGSGRREGSFRYELKDTYNGFHHVAISFNKRACKIYFDEQRVANIPNAVAPKWVQFRGSYDYPGMYFWKNFRIAKGAVPLYDRLQNEGKIVTYGITFDLGKATIKNESMGEINRIKSIMDQNPGLKFEVQGHCDNTGSATVNDKLSQQRAEAIVAKLVELGIGKDRLTAVGKGSRVPIADNSTDEGRAKNRRVEFVKQ